MHNETSVLNILKYKLILVSQKQTMYTIKTKKIYFAHENPNMWHHDLVIARTSILNFRLHLQNGPKKTSSHKYVVKYSKKLLYEKP